MAAAALGIISALFYQSGCAFGIAALYAVLLMLLSGLGANSGTQLFFTAAAATVLMPVAGYVAALLVERFAFIDNQSTRRPALGQIGTLLGVCVLFEGVPIGSIIEALQLANDKGSALSISAVIMTSVNAVVVCASIVAVCLMLVALLAEVPMRMFGHIAGMRATLPFPMLRMWVVLMFFALSSQLIVGLFIAELSPLMLVRNAVEK